MSLNLDWDYLEILLLLLAFGTLVPVVICVAIFCCCQHQFSILKSPIICQKCLFYVYFEILLLLLLAFGIPIPVVICVAIFCCCQHQFNILKSPIICQKCLFYIYFEILWLLLLAFGIPVPVVVVCGAIFCCWLLPPPTNWGHGIL